MLEEKIQISSERLKEIVLDIASDLDWSIENDDGSISLVCEGDFFSFGNKIEVEIVPAKSENSQIKVKSKSQFAIQLFDWGKNRELEEKILKEIKDRIES